MCNDSMVFKVSPFIQCLAPGNNNQMTAANKLKRKPSKNGGRTIATPSNTASALAAGKRRGNKTHSTMDKVADIIVKGELGKEDASILKRILDHTCNATGLDIKEAMDPNQPKTREYVYLASVGLQPSGIPADPDHIIWRIHELVVIARYIYVQLEAHHYNYSRTSLLGLWPPSY